VTSERGCWRAVVLGGLADHGGLEHSKARYRAGSGMRRMGWAAAWPVSALGARLARPSRTGGWRLEAVVAYDLSSGALGHGQHLVGRSRGQGLVQEDAVAVAGPSVDLVTICFARASMAA
jgi:hypothetical protein